MPKGKKQKVNSLAVGFCLDESGSMEVCREQTISGFNEYVDELRKQDGETLLSLTMFSTEPSLAPVVPESPNGRMYRPFCEAAPIAEVPRLSTENYRPHGGTPLLDAIGATIRSMEEQLAARKKQPDAVLFVIQTDGEENSSREFSREAVRALIARKESEGWRFVYLGANQDGFTAERISTSMGLQAGASMSYDYAATASVHASLADSSAQLRGATATDSADLAKTAVTGTARREKEKRS